jgi:hypothetical protein
MPGCLKAMHQGRPDQHSDADSDERRKGNHDIPVSVCGKKQRYGQSLFWLKIPFYKKRGEDVVASPPQEDLAQPFAKEKMSMEVFLWRDELYYGMRVVVLCSPPSACHHERAYQVYPLGGGVIVYG